MEKLSKRKSKIYFNKIIKIKYLVNIMQMLNFFKNYNDTESVSKSRK